MSLKNGPILVTGATGFLGQHLTRELIKRGFEVHVLTRDLEKAEAIFKNTPIQIIKASLTDYSSLLKIPKNAFIVHCAAIIGSERASITEYNRVNIEGTRNLLHAAIKNTASHFVFVSSISAVGAEGSLENPITEKTIPNPKTYYGQSKLTSERMILQLAPSNMPVTIIRPPLIYGQGQSDRSGAGTLFNMCSKSRIPVIGDATSLIPLVHVKNLVSGLLDLSAQNTGKEIFNLADSTPYTLRNLSDAIKVHVGNEARFIQIPLGMAKLLGKCGDGLSRLFKKDVGPCTEVVNILARNGFVMSIDKALNVGFKPMLGLVEGLAEMFPQSHDDEVDIRDYPQIEPNNIESFDENIIAIRSNAREFRGKRD